MSLIWFVSQQRVLQMTPPISWAQETEKLNALPGIALKRRRRLMKTGGVGNLLDLMCLSDRFWLETRKFKEESC